MKKFLLYLLGTTVIIAVALSVQVLTANNVAAIDEPASIASPGDEDYKRPSCESPSGNRGCGDRQYTSCSFGKKVNC